MESGLEPLDEVFHRVKGMAGNVGAMNLVEFAKLMEMKIKGHEAYSPDEVIATFDRHVQDARVEFKRLMKAPKAYIYQNI